MTDYDVTVPIGYEERISFSIFCSLADRAVTKNYSICFLMNKIMSYILKRVHLPDTHQSLTNSPSRDKSPFSQRDESPFSRRDKSPFPQRKSLVTAHTYNLLSGRTRPRDVASRDRYWTLLFARCY